MLLLENALLILALALAIDAIIGDPDWLWRRLPHPVVWFGKAISVLDKRWNQPVLRGVVGERRGATALGIWIAGTALFACALQSLLLMLPYGWFCIAIVAAIFLAQNSLYVHVGRVAHALEYQGLAEARREVAMIVGRDPERLDEAGASRASIESLAENFSDGVVAPAFWFALAGLPGLLVYKMINTADSMIGHRTEEYRAFGWASAKLDDLVNWPAARLTALLTAIAAPLVGGSLDRSWKAVQADATKHRSPNAGWPEAAFAGALDIALSGPRHYATGPTNEPYIHPGGRLNLTADDIRKALKLFLVACVIQCAIFLLLGLRF